MHVVAKRLEALGITLPRPAAPVANYVPVVKTGSLVVVSGQVPFGLDGKIANVHTGKLTSASPIEHARDAARLCAINLIAQLEAEILDLCRARLPRHMVPVTIRFVPTLDILSSGKLARHHA